MKIIKNELLNAVKICSTVRNTSGIPLWDNLLFQCVDGEVVITGRDPQHILSHRIKKEDGSCEPFLFDGSLMIKLLSGCPDDIVSIGVNESRVSIAFDHASFDFSHKASDAEEYIHALPDYGQQQAAAGIPSYYLRDHAKAWEVFAGNDDLRPVMKYICIELTDGAGYIVTTNAHILFRVKFEWHCEEPQTFILPSRLFSKLSKLLPKQDIKLMRYEREWNGMGVGNTTLIYYATSDKYPNWRAVIPVSAQKMTFNAKELMATVKLVHLFANSSTHQMILEATDKGVGLHTHDFDYDSHAYMRIKADRQGDPIKIGFNTVLLQQCLKQIKGKEITMEYTQPNRAVVFTGDASTEVMALLMPVMINE